MKHENYIGKKLKELTNDKRFIVKFYEISYNGKIHHLDKLMNDENCMNKIIKSITPCEDCTYWIQLK